MEKPKRKKKKNPTIGDISFRLVEMLDAPFENYGGKMPPKSVFLDREKGICVQCWNVQTTEKTPWRGMIKAGVKMTKAQTMKQYIDRSFDVPITWDQLQEVRRQLWPERIAIEVFPPARHVVNQANMRWLWVLPENADLPFSLDPKKSTILS